MKNFLITIVIFLIISFLIGGLLEFNKSSSSYIYGNSYRQNRLVNTIRLHEYGITGRNVVVGILDAGFNTKHPVFKDTRIIKEFDFATNKADVLNKDHKKGMDHGTNVFSVTGGYKINELIGVAFGADYILAKSDISTDRLTREEDNAIAASRWLFENGAKIITTSLSFNKFDNADYYHSNQMDGNTARITRTADSLVNNGIVFTCSAGNNYEDSWHIVEAPGDGFNVLAVGSIDKYSTHSFFSSCGPTIDGRIKPDLVAPGEGVWVANSLTKIKPEFGWSHGTSLSAPIVAGIAALVLSAHPELSNDQVVEAIKKTSSKSDNPDTLYGWGIPDAEKAVSYFGPAFSNIPELIDHGNKVEIRTYVFSSYGLMNSSVEVYLQDSISGKEVVYKMKETGDNYYICKIGVKPGDQKFDFYFKAIDKRGYLTKFPSGFLGDYFICRKEEGKIKIVGR
ncbi:MAG: S8 family serine peptidase [Ignavibacteria bacterium]|jgi:subtilisin family serine protease